MNQRLPSINSFLQFQPPPPQPSLQLQQQPPKLDSFFIRIQPKLTGNRLDLFSSSSSFNFKDFLLISEFIHLFLPFINYNSPEEAEAEEEEEELKWFDVLGALLSTGESGFYTLLVCPLLKYILQERHQYKSFTTLFSTFTGIIPYDSSSVPVTEYTSRFLLSKTMQRKISTELSTKDRIDLLLELISVISNDSVKFKEYIDSLYSKEKELRRMAKTESSYIQQELKKLEAESFLKEQEIEEFIEKWKELRRIDRSIPKEAISYILSNSNGTEKGKDFSAECLLRYKVFLQNRTLGVDLEGREYFLFSSIPGLFVFQQNQNQMDDDDDEECFVVTEPSELQLFLKLLKDYPLKSNLQASCVDNEMICGTKQQFSVNVDLKDVVEVNYKEKCERVLRELIEKGAIYGSIEFDHKKEDVVVVDLVEKLIQVEESSEEEEVEIGNERKKKKTTRSGIKNKKTSVVKMSLLEKIYFYYSSTSSSEEDHDDKGDDDSTFREETKIDLNELLKLRRAFNNFLLCLKENKDDEEVVCYLLCLLEDTVLG